MNAAESTVIVVGGQEFWAPESSQGLRMAEAFHQLGCEVLYLECGGAGRLFRERTRGLRKASPGVFAHPERERFFLGRAERLPLVRLSYPDVARRLHCRRAAKKAARFLARPGGHRDGPVLVAHYGWFFPEFSAGAGARERHLYECLDDHAAALNIRNRAWKRRYVLETERRLLVRADLTVFSSPFLAQARAGSDGRAEVIPLGVDHAHFASPSGRDPYAPRGIGRPRVGFLGQVTDREDWAMVAAAAELVPDWEWVVLGPLRGVTPRGPEHLHWLGPVPYAELPDWLAGWDAAFVPLADSPFNRASWPLKFYECLAAGLAVASTPIPAARELAEATGRLVVPAPGWGPAELVAALAQARSERARARIQGPAFAARHSWTARAERILKLLA